MPAFVVFGLASQILLLGFFAAHLWRAALEARLGGRPWSRDRRPLASLGARSTLTSIWRSREEMR